jgi:hypothetical protein
MANLANHPSAEENHLFWPQIGERSTEFAEKNTSTTAKSANRAFPLRSLRLCGEMLLSLSGWLSAES